MSAPFTAIVLAGRRGETDALCLANGVTHKALIPICGQPMLVRVVETVLQSGACREVVISITQPELALGLAPIAALVERGRVRLVKSGASPSASLLAAIDAAQGAWPLLVTTADHPLLHAEMIRYFLDHAAPDADAIAAVVDRTVILPAYPKTQRTYLRFRDMACSGANLFLLRTPRAKGVVSYWRNIEANRKRPLRLMTALGFGTVLRFITGALDMGRALEALGRRCDAKLAIVTLPYAEAAIDVDKPADLTLVTQILQTRDPQRQS